MTPEMHLNSPRPAPNGHVPYTVVSGLIRTIDIADQNSCFSRFIKRARHTYDNKRETRQTAQLFHIVSGS